MTSAPATQILVEQTARRFKAYLCGKNGGRIPRSLAGWRRLSQALGVPAGPPAVCPRAFTARLFFAPEIDSWIIAYNPTAPRRRQCRFVCHELFEYLALGDFPGLCDEITAGCHYDGGPDPHALRHRIACHGERLCFRRPD